MPNFLSFIKSRQFIKHLLIYISIIGLIIWLLVIWLANFTSHGKKINVPNFLGKKIENLDAFISDKNLNYLIIDSVYDTKSANGSVYKQEPEPNTDVKEGRTIYLYTTTKIPPSILMPKLIDRSLRQAISMITSYGLKLGTIKYIPDQCVNCILEQIVKNKDDIRTINFKNEKFKTMSNLMQT